MAKKTKKKQGSGDELLGSSHNEPVVEDVSHDSEITYTMGDIQVEGSEEAPVAKKKEEKDELDEEWGEEELKDEDPFLDAEENYDPDNPYGEY